MKQEYAQLVGELIGLARATDGNEHLINPSATATIRECLTRIAEETADVPALLQKVEEEKRNMVPNCFVCANPCGRTSAFDLSELPVGEIGQLKQQLLDALCRNARTLPEGILYRDLVIIGLTDYTREDLLPLIQEIDG